MTSTCCLCLPHDLQCSVVLDAPSQAPSTPTQSCFSPSFHVVEGLSWPPKGVATGVTPRIIFNKKKKKCRLFVQTRTYMEYLFSINFRLFPIRKNSTSREGEMIFILVIGQTHSRVAPLFAV